MNCFKTLLTACLLLLLVASCNNEPERHELTPAGDAFVLYADQTLDSLHFYSYDSWTVTPQVEWVSVYGPSHTDVVNDNTQYRWNLNLIVEPNTTGRTRRGSVFVHSYDYSYSSPVVQLGLLFVSHPNRTVDTWIDERSGIPDVAHYELIENARWTADSICFTVENPWSLRLVDATPAGWLQLDATSGPAEEHCRVNLAFSANRDEENERRATLRLISGEVFNDITVRQLPAK